MEDPLHLHYKQISLLPYEFDFCVLLFLKRWTKGIDLKNSDADFWHQPEIVQRHSGTLRGKILWKGGSGGLVFPASPGLVPVGSAGRPSEPSVSGQQSQGLKTSRSEMSYFFLCREGSLTREQRTVAEKHTWNCHPGSPAGIWPLVSITCVFCSDKPTIPSGCELGKYNQKSVLIIVTVQLMEVSYYRPRK